MYKKNIILCLMALLITACNKNSGPKVQNVIFFTPPIEVESDSPNVKLPKVSKSTLWAEGSNWVNSQPGNFDSKISEKFSSYLISKGGNIIAAPIIVDGKIFTLSENGYLNSYNKDSYKLLWSLDLNNHKSNGSVSHYRGGIAYSEGKIYVTDYTRDLMVVDAKIGAILWRYKMPDITKSQPVIHKNKIFIVTVSNDLYAIDKNTGDLIWQNDGIAEMLSSSRDVSPIVYDGKVIACYSSGQLVALDEKNGETLWELNLTREGDNLIPGFIPVSLESQPIVDSTGLYLTSGNGILLKVNAHDGSIVWQKKIYDIHSMNKSGNSLFITTNAMQVSAVNDSTGKVVWVTSLFDRDERKRSVRSRNPVNLLTPVVINDNLFITSSGGKLYQLSPYDGKILKEQVIAKDANYITVDDSFNIFTRKHIFVAK